MMRAVIVDDVELARRSLAGDIAEHCPDVIVVGEASGVATGAAVVRQLRPDLLFLDVTLDDGSGFDLLDRIGDNSAMVILTTASDAHGIRGVKSGAIDYLLKPIDPDELASAVERARARFAARGSHGGAQAQDRPAILPGPVRRIALNTADRVHVVALEEILRCESHRNYTLFHLSGKRNVLVTRTLKEFEELLEPYGFFRVHHSHLINISFVREYVKGEGGYAIMADGTHVTVAVRKKESLLRLLGVDRERP